MAKYEKTQGAAARALKTTSRTFTDWLGREDFPKKTDQGYDIEAIDGWCKQNQLGKYRRPSTRIGGDTITSARIRNLKAQAARDELALQSEKIEFDLLLGKILLADDVAGLFQRTAATITRLIEAIYDRADRAAPVTLSSLESWPAVRSLLMSEILRGIRDAISGAEEFVKGEAEAE